MFTSEKKMSISFERFLVENFGKSYLKECQGLFGVPDFVFYHKGNQDTSVISFELKLKNWKQAAKQAFRYRTFSNFSYVILEGSNVRAARNNIEIFQKYNIGLASFGKDNSLEIIHKPKEGIPFSETLNQKFLASIKSTKKKSKNTEGFIKLFTAQPNN